MDGSQILTQKQTTPYSLGKLIDWKRFLLLVFDVCVFAMSPYSLGKLIDWKQSGKERNGWRNI